VLFSSRRSDDADVIRARLRALLAEGADRRGWLPDADPDPDPGTEPDGPDGPDRGTVRHPEPWADDQDTDTWSTDPDDDVVAPARWGESGGTGRHRASGPSTRIDPGPHGARTLWLVALVAALLVAGWSWVSRPEVSPAPASGAAAQSPAAAVDDAAVVSAASTGQPTGTSGTAAQGTEAPQIVVAVVGHVASPGLVTLPAGSRVADALAAAGGLLPDADPASVNAAAVLADGQQVAVGVPGAGGPAPGSGDAAGGSGLLDLNAAGLADLDALPGIGPVLAQRILDHRSEHGPFTSVEQLDDVSGIGPSLYAQIAPLVTV
jgi:competence protein ComEA